MSFFAKVRRVVYGPGKHSTGPSVLSNVGRLEYLGAMAEPGPFDTPPVEPIVLDPDLPWELRETDDRPQQRQA
jgi:hypothetical protein